MGLSGEGRTRNEKTKSAQLERIARPRQPVESRRGSRPPCSSYNEYHSANKGDFYSSKDRCKTAPGDWNDSPGDESAGAAMTLLGLGVTGIGLGSTATGQTGSPTLGKGRDRAGGGGGDMIGVVGGRGEVVY